MWIAVEGLHKFQQPMFAQACNTTEYRKGTGIPVPTGHPELPERWERYRRMRRSSTTIKALVPGICLHLDNRWLCEMEYRTTPFAEPYAALPTRVRSRYRSPSSTNNNPLALGNHWSNYSLSQIPQTAHIRAQHVPGLSQGWNYKTLTSGGVTYR